MIFRITALVLLIFFYGVYLGKMIIQNRKGIKTDRIASKGKQGSLYITELILRIASYGIIIAEIASIFLNTALLPPVFRIAGAAIAALGDIIFAVAVYTMRDSWRAGIAQDEKTELITSGIYSISRNPAFLGFYIVYTGILMMFFNWILLAVTVFTVSILHLQILQEEKHLADAFGNEYITYKSKVKRYFTLSCKEREALRRL